MVGIFPRMKVHAIKDSFFRFLLRFTKELYYGSEQPVQLERKAAGVRDPDRQRKFH